MINHDDHRALVGVTHVLGTALVSVALDDGTIIDATLAQLSVPTDRTIASVCIDDCNAGVEFYFTDGTMHDVCGDVIKALGGFSDS